MLSVDRDDELETARDELETERCASFAFPLLRSASFAFPLLRSASFAFDVFQWRQPQNDGVVESTDTREPEARPSPNHPKSPVKLPLRFPAKLPLLLVASRLLNDFNRSRVCA